jgi:mannose-6-phosphate isomerase-like protein (cupin superfamily)
MAKSIRRVVTGHDRAGKSIFVMDGASPHVFSRTPGTTVVTELWETTRTPADNRGADDAIRRKQQLAPPKNGSVFRVVEYPPDAVRLAALARERTLPDDGSERSVVRDRDNPRHAGFHKTNTVDYAIVLSGEIYAMMDEGEVLLKAGEVLIQRGTNHAWSNRTDAPAVVAFVLIDAEPV